MTPPLYTERDVVLRERAAFLEGVAYERGTCFDSQPHVEMAKRFPLATITRPRSPVPDPHVQGMVWTVEQVGDDRWMLNLWAWTGLGPLTLVKAPAKPTPERVALWSDLLANPTEEEDGDGILAAAATGAPCE